MIYFGERLKNLRIQNRMTQAVLAERLGVTKSVISAYETGLRMPSYETLIAIARIFKVSTDYLLGVKKKYKDLDLSGLTDEEVNALTALVQAMKKNS